MARLSRLHTQSPALSSRLWYLVLMVICLIAVWAILPRHSSPYPRQTMVVVGSPMTVVSWNERDRSFTLISLTEDLTTEGTHGYGTYSLESFWKLGEIDKKDGTVLSESLSEALAVPVSWYIGPQTGLFAGVADALTVTKQTFSFKNAISYLSGGYRTNIPITTFLKFVWILQVSKPQRTDTYDFTHNPSLIADVIPIADGSNQIMINPVRLDARLAHVFEDERLRRETVTTAVLNTTTIPSLGNRVGRLLGTLGISVVAVGNDTPEIDTCTISGTKESIRSMSAKVIESVLGCSLNQVSEAERADLTVRVGASYAKRFVPN